MVRRLKVKNLILAIISLILVCTLIYSASKIIMWFMDNNKTDNVIKKVQDIVEVEDTSNTEVIEVKEEIDEFNPYWDYIDMNDKINRLMFNRIIYHKEYYNNNEMLKSIYEYFAKIIEKNYTNVNI